MQVGIKRLKRQSSLEEEDEQGWRDAVLTCFDDLKSVQHTNLCAYLEAVKADQCVLVFSSHLERNFRNSFCK